ncbi:unnamed protein product [Euphydryas editha]|uniref:Uncharacterized protein n=1 Tax=Euphydryas editha TaxID=104508 RepID=A0AAU9UCK4_EUPED|nr:unnamed protein product [Euphydryas editha]
MESKKYIVVKNHVREIRDEEFSSEDSSKNALNYKKNQKKKKSRKQSSSSTENSASDNEVCVNDLEELKTVYKKCKDVLMKIESKYGHLLNKETNENGEDKISIKNKRKHDSEPDDQSDCDCISNRKIIFTDDGQQILEEGSNTQNHICPKKLKCYDKHYHEKNQSIEIEHENVDFVLPENMQELTELLKKPSINNSLRNSITEKIKNIRNENFNMFRLHKEEIIQNLKTNPDGFLGFKGSNLSSLPGYPK